DTCHSYSLAAPKYAIFSDPRGRRTAWTAEVTIDNKVFRARNFYDGSVNAFRDAAEVAFIFIKNNSITHTMMGQAEMLPRC
ncbi:hypothetical protein QBC38DRAFT_378285, partial [Podospora fimiseda]